MNDCWRLSESDRWRLSEGGVAGGHIQLQRRHGRVTTMAASSSACSEPTVDFAGLANASRHRHRCEVLRQLCFFNGTLVPLSAGPHADQALRVATSMVVRSQFGSHATFPLTQLHPMLPPGNGSSAAAILERHGSPLSRCVPLVWVPTWAFSFADSFVSSLVPIDELQSAGLLDEHVLLRPDLVSWPRQKNPIYRMIGALSAQPIRTVREAAHKCWDADAARFLRDAATAAKGGRGVRRSACTPTCYERVLVCNLKSTFDAYAPPMAPWRAGQRVAESVVQRRPVGASTAMAASAKAAAAAAARLGGHPPRLRVVFVNRTRTKFSRSLTNLKQLLQRCASPRTRWAGGALVECSAHEFGAHSLSRDVRAAREADVLVGTHGAGLANAFFLRRGAKRRLMASDGLRWPPMASDCR